MAEIVTAYSASHAPMQAADPGSAPPDQAERFFGALEAVREQAKAAGPQAVVMLSGEHFTNYFLDCLPQLAIGLAERYETPSARWLKMEGTEIPGDPALGMHIAERLMAANLWPALSYEMEPDHGFLTVYHQLDPTWRTPLVPMVLNCTTPPLMTLRQSYDFGVVLGDALRSYQGVERVALVGGGALSHFVGEPRVGDIDEEFDHWFLEQLGKEDLGELLDLPNEELMEAGNGTGEVRAWVAVAGAMRGHKMNTLSYEAIYEWINGMGVVSYSTS
jgi:aromatic ring-opening dioxygenase catalytic subunit (LigB family)